jgi:hypothetical protein
MTDEKRARAPKRRWKTEPWPNPADTREDRAKRVAASYRDLLQRMAAGERDTYGLPLDAAGELYRLDQYWLRHGAFWAVPSYDPYDADDWVTAVDASHYADVESGTVRKWAARGHIRAEHLDDGTPVYNIGDIRNYRTRGRLERVHRTDDVSATG